MSDPHTVVFGGAGALGFEMSKVLAERGHRVTIADIGSPSDAVTTFVEGGHDYVQCDVTDLESVRAVVGASSSAAQASGIVYAAGVNYTGPVITTDWNAYDRLLAVNLKGAFHVASVAQESRRDRSYVFVSSVAGLTGEAGGSVYCATKFGLIGFAQSFAAEITPLGGRVNIVCPGNVNSPLLQTLAEQVAEREGTTSEEMLAEFANASAFERLIEPTEVAHSVAYLLSEYASGISGQTVVIDGPTN